MRRLVHLGRIMSEVVRFGLAGGSWMFVAAVLLFLTAMIFVSGVQIVVPYTIYTLF